MKNLKIRSNEGEPKETYEKWDKEARSILLAIAKWIDEGLEPSSKQVQRLIEQHHRFAEQFHNASREVYQAMAQLNREHFAYRNQLDPIDPRLAEFMANAMDCFAQEKLT